MSDTATQAVSTAPSPGTGEGQAAPHAATPEPPPLSPALALVAAVRDVIGTAAHRHIARQSA